MTVQTVREDASLSS